MAAYDRAHELAREIRTSAECREYQKAKQELLKSEAALSILRDLRKARLEYEMSLLAGKEPDEEKKREADKLTEIAAMHGAVSRFLDAERRIMVMMTDVQKILTDALDLLEYG